MHGEENDDDDNDERREEIKGGDPSRIGSDLAAYRRGECKKSRNRAGGPPAHSSARYQHKSSSTLSLHFAPVKTHPVRTPCILRCFRLCIPFLPGTPSFMRGMSKVTNRSGMSIRRTAPSPSPLRDFNERRRAREK